MPEGQVMVSTQPTVRKPNVSAQTELQLQIDRHQRDLHLNRSQYHGERARADHFAVGQTPPP